jgi:hypothetical protein
MVRDSTDRPIAVDAHPKHTMALGAAYFAGRPALTAAVAAPEPPAAREGPAGFGPLIVASSPEPAGAAEGVGAAPGSSSGGGDAPDRSRRSLFGAALAVALLVIAVGIGVAALSGSLGGSVGATLNPEPTLALTIVIAGTPHVVHEAEISYEELVALAFPDQTPDPNLELLFRYRRGPSDRPRGTVAAGDSVKVADGMTFDLGAVA